MYRAALALSADRELARDATQEAFARALSRWRRLEGEPWAGGWVMTVALNVVRRALRRKPSLPPPEDTSPDLDALLDLRRAIRALPHRQQAAVVLYYLGGYPVSKVAGAMGCREGTVRAHLAVARRSLGRTLGGQAAPDPSMHEGEMDG